MQSWEINLQLLDIIILNEIAPVAQTFLMVQIMKIHVVHFIYSCVSIISSCSILVRNRRRYFHADIAPFIAATYLILSVHLI